MFWRGRFSIWLSILIIIDVIFDLYRENSIKNAERQQRGAEYGNELRNIQTDHKVQQRRKFYLNPTNKKAFTVFMSKEWKQETYQRRLTDKVLFVACEEECHQISSKGLFTAKTLTKRKKKPIEGFHFISPMQQDPGTAHWLWPLKMQISL